MTLKYFESICSTSQLEADKTYIGTMRVVTLLIVWNEKVPLLRHSLIWMVKATTHWSDFTDWKFVVISCYRFKSLITMYFAFILEHFMWCFSPPSNFIHCFMRWYRWMAWRGLPTTNSFTRHSVSWAHLPNLLPCATACDPFKKKKRKFKWKTEIWKEAFELFIKISLKCHRELGQVSNKDPVSRIFEAEKISLFLRLLHTELFFWNT